MDSKSLTTTDLNVDKIKDVTESLKEEFNLTLNAESEADYVNTGPPPNMKRRRLIFDSMRTRKVVVVAQSQAQAQRIRVVMCMYLEQVITVN